MCLREGVYATHPPTPEALAAMPGAPCPTVAILACKRSAASMRAAVERALGAAPLPEPFVTASSGP